jgi:hypothetical protein
MSALMEESCPSVCYYVISETTERVSIISDIEAYAERCRENLILVHTAPV